jgi:hypothetical protein
MSDDQLKEVISVLRAQLHLQRMILVAESQKMAKELLETPRYADDKRLAKYGNKVFSQNEEDGIIAEILRRIGVSQGTFVEFGVEGGLENNTAYLLTQGWKGGWIEGSEKSFSNIGKTFAAYIASGHLTVANNWVSAENIEEIIESFGFEYIDVLSIDIDGNDYWVWNAIKKWQPKVVIIEYNAILPPEKEWIIKYSPNFRSDSSMYHSASLKSLELLGRKKGYGLVGCNLNGVNAFFVRGDLMSNSTGHLFCDPYTAENHYEPARHAFLKFFSGKRASPQRPITSIDDAE